MIKLFWNTHNQKKSTTKDQQVIKRESENHKWGAYHKKNSNIWIFEILKKINFSIIDSEKNLNKEDTLIIIDSSPETKIEFYNKINLTCSKVFLLHLGDETGAYDLSQIYSKCDFVFRPFCSSKYFNNEKVKCIPIGYKSGVTNKKKRKRKYKWAFTGTPHKTSRHDLLFQLSDIKPFFCHRTEKFDTKIISVEEMSEILSSTQFLPCPNGFFHPETYRLYEALECGCIPIVESAYQYYDRLFPKNPFIKIDKWLDAKTIVNKLSIEEINSKREECENWWVAYKTDLQEFIKNRVLDE